MKKFALGRSVNLKGKSFYDPVITKPFRDDALKNGLSQQDVLAVSSGRAAAMYIVFPMVWYFH